MGFVPNRSPRSTRGLPATAHSGQSAWTPSNGSWRKTHDRWNPGDDRRSSGAALRASARALRRRVWRAVSAPAELERWFPAAADWTPETGETFEAYGATGEVTEVDAPRRLAWTFAGERYIFDLTAEEEGYLLVFTHVFDNPRARSANRSRVGSLPLAARAPPRRRAPLRRGGTRANGGSPRTLRRALRGRPHSRPALPRGSACPQMTMWQAPLAA
ncbi:MAG: SRPBCC family protein [Acidimicrobiales bacterium]